MFSWCHLLLTWYHHVSPIKYNSIRIAQAIAEFWLAVTGVWPRNPPDLFDVVETCAFKAGRVRGFQPEVLQWDEGLWLHWKRRHSCHLWEGAAWGHGQIPVFRGLQARWPWQQEHIFDFRSDKTTGFQRWLQGFSCGFSMGFPMGFPAFLLGWAKPWQVHCRARTSLCWRPRCRERFQGIRCRLGLVSPCFMGKMWENIETDGWTLGFWGYLMTNSDEKPSDFIGVALPFDGLRSTLIWQVRTTWGFPVTPIFAAPGFEACQNLVKGVGITFQPLYSLTAGHLQCGWQQQGATGGAPRHRVGAMWKSFWWGCNTKTKVT